MNAHPPYNQPPGAGNPIPQPNMNPSPDPTSKKKQKKKGRGNGDRAETEKAPTRKVLGLNRNLALLFALLAAGLTALTFLAQEPPKDFVVRTTAAVPAMAQLSANMIEAVEIDEPFIEAGAYTAPTAEEALELALEDVEGANAVFPIPAGRQISPDMFGFEVTLRSPLDPDERLMSISADVSNALGGRLQVADRVDVIAVNRDQIAGVIVEDVELVALTVAENLVTNAAQQQASEEGRDRSRDELLPGDPIPGIYTLRVAAADTTALAAIDAYTDVYLVYRPSDADDTDAPATSTLEVVCGIGTAAPDDMDETPAVLPIECGEPTTTAPAQ